MINLQQLSVLLAVREYGSLTKAADALGYGVPTVTHHLNTLERHLRVRLAERDRRGATLTPLGAAFAEEAEQILQRVGQAERLVAEQRDAGLVTLRVGTFASIGSRLLPSAIAELQQRVRVRVEVIEAEPTEVVRLLLAGDVHAGLIYEAEDDPAFVSAELAVVPLLLEPYRVMLSRNSALAAQEVLDFAQLHGEAWIHSRSDNEASDRVLKKTFSLVGHQPRELMRTDDLNMIHGLVAQGLGLALSTETAVDTRFDVTLRPAVQDLGKRRVSFITLNFTTLNKAMPPAIGLLEKLLRERTAGTASG